MGLQILRAGYIVRGHSDSSIERQSQKEGTGRQLDREINWVTNM